MARTWSEGVEGQPGRKPISTLASPISAGATSSTVDTGHGAAFPATGDWVLRFEDPADEHSFETVVGGVTTGDSIAHGATTYAWPAGTKVIHVIGKADIDALQTALDAKQALSEKGENDGYAPLDSGGDVPLEHLGNVPAGDVVHDQDTTAETTASSTTETTHYSKTIAAADMPTGAVYRLTLIAERLNNTGGIETATMRVKFGTTTIWTATLGGSSSAQRHRYRISVLLFITGSATQALAGDLIGTRDTSDGAVSTTTTFAVLAAGAATENVATDKALAVTFQNSANSASLEVKTNVALLERLA
jgi:hypothetical protein